MGWTSYHAKYYKNGKVDRKRECDENLTWSNEKCISTVLKSRMVGTTYYAAVKQHRLQDDGTWKDTVFAAITLTSGQDRSDPYFNFACKDMSESMGPYECKCPKSILDLLTPTESKYALEWRRKCRENLTKPKSWLLTCPVGTQIILTTWNGKEKHLVKHAPSHQFKTWFWYDPSTNTYVSKKHVTENNSRIAVGS